MFITPLFISGNEFWTGAGGLRSVNIGITPPLFVGDITIRGGIWGMMFRNTSTTLPVSIKIYIGTTVAFPNYTVPSSSNIGWDPSVEPDLSQNFAKFNFNNTVQLEPGETWKIERRVGIKKVDKSVWDQTGYMPMVLISAFNVGHATATTINIETYYNMSFAADAVGTT